MTISSPFVPASVHTTITLFAVIFADLDILEHYSRALNGLVLYIQPIIIFFRLGILSKTLIVSCSYCRPSDVAMPKKQVELWPQMSWVLRLPLRGLIY